MKRHFLTSVLLLAALLWGSQATANYGGGGDPPDKANNACLWAAVEPPGQQMPAEKQGIQTRRERRAFRFIFEKPQAFRKIPKVSKFKPLNPQQNHGRT